ncbi:hypothetical protein [Streptomyces afghaniensis]|uniref:hypothetical protein n=1 Tax=Streptomyces afghaniensis TaxID=66865 RepID=UPI002781E6D3|nr:hypothetical protein [Streptomyces afghaniensis]MDQ1018951.1 hypothetical protein [Streptomyces afghaniensis]
MVEIGLLAGAAVGILGDLMAGVVQGAAANTVSDLVTSRLRGAEGGNQALARLEEQPRDPARRMEAAGALAAAAQDDPEYTARLRDAVNLYSQSTNQGTATSGSPHHQVNINGGGVSGKNYMIAGGNIDARKKRNIRIGLGAFAVVLVAFGGYKVVQWASDGDEAGTRGQSSTREDNIALPGVGPEEAAPDVKKVDFDLTGSYVDLGDEEHFFRARGEVSITVGEPYKVDEGCSVKAPSGTSIVPVTIEMINTNDPAWSESEKFEPDTADVFFKDPPESLTIRNRSEAVTCGPGTAISTGSQPGEYREQTFLLIGVPEGKETEIKLAAAGPDGATGPLGHEPYHIEGDLDYRPKMKIFPVSIKG